MRASLLTTCALAALVFSASAFAATPAPWKSVSVVRQAGTVTASLTYERQAQPYGSYDFRHMLLVVKNGGKTVLSRQLCSTATCGVATQHTLKLANVWGDSTPEVVVDIFTGGAHCCYQSLVVLTTGPRAGHVLAHFWGDPGYRGLVHDGTFEFLTADDRFAYEFTSYAGSGMPVQVLQINAAGTKFVDVTTTRLDLVRADAKGYWHAYVTGRGKANSDIRGVLAAWCGDEYLLGDKAACTAELARAVAHGWVKSDTMWATNQKFVALVEKDLTRWGY